MKRVLITGANGFIGKNLYWRLNQFGRPKKILVEKGCSNQKWNNREKNNLKWNNQDETLEILSYDIDNAWEELCDFINRADFIFHLAGINRSKRNEDFETGNKCFTEKLVNILENTGKNTPLLISSSIQAAQDNPYGASKKGAEEAVFEYGRRTGARVCVYRLPNVFGKWSRPHYNSVVATWCYNISRNLPIQINSPDTEIELVYIDHVIDEFINALNGYENRGEDGFCHIFQTFKTSLNELADILYSFKQSRATLVVPNLQGDFQRFLYAQYLSYLPENDFGYNLQMRHDNRGWLAEFIKSKQFGQIFISCTKPGVTRGNHWHHTKAEKFLVIEGEALIKFRKINKSNTTNNTTKNTNNIIEYRVSGKELKVLDIPVGYTHSITNIGQTELFTIFWANEIFNPDKPDTYYLEPRVP
jgi:UDP-2-acetamido-2,6-beta-L-arabino-hexul-4-ose reductase